MALPTLTYIKWRFNVNQDLNNPGTGIACFRQLIRRIKTTLITGSGWTDSTNSGVSVSMPWAVVASSDSVSAINSDLWTADGYLVWAAAGSAHSWIVLRQTGIHGSNFEICLDLNSAAASYHQLTVVVSWAGFTLSGLSITNRPTATDEKVLISQATWITATATTFDCILHVFMTDEGECNRVVVCVGGAPISVWSFDKPNSPVVGWNLPATAFVLARSSTTYTLLYNARGIFIRYSGITSSVYLSAETHSSAASGTRLTVANDLTSEWPLWAPKLINDGYGGIMGEYPDAWWGSTGPADGDCYPASGTTQQFVHFSDLVQPWNQTTPLLT